jgi:hypothetical protein
MKGQELFHLLSLQEYGMAINPATDLQMLLLDTRTAQKLYDGSILQPIEDHGEKQEGIVKIVEPADYPTDLLQPLFRFLRERKEVRAAWLFRKTETSDPTRPYYVFALNVAGNFRAVEQDFSVVLLNVGKGDFDYGVVPVDESNPKFVEITLKYPAFYAAPDYRAPSPLGE